MSAAFGLRRSGVRFEYWGAALLRLLLFGALFVAFTLVGAFLLGIVGVDAPTSQFAAVSVTLVAAVLAGWILLHWADKRSIGALGFTWPPKVRTELLAGFAIGGGGLAAGAVVLAAIGLLRYESEPGTTSSYITSLAVPLGFFAVAGAAEEALFRGYPFQVLVRAIGALPATILASALFAIAHRLNPGVSGIALINIFLAGILLSFAYLRTRSLWFATAVHLGWNWTMGVLFDLPVSGLRLFDTPYYDSVVHGPVSVTGGSFGPEGGFIAAFSFVLMGFAVLRAPALDESPAMRMLQPLVDSDESPGE